jgi:hypothetical protein
MKQKLLVVLLLLLMSAIAFLSYDAYHQYQQQLLSMQQEQQNNQRQIADLNDRLVALARQQQPSLNLLGGLVSPQVVDSHNAAQQLQLQMQQNELKQAQQQWLKSSLQLAQQALSQGNAPFALQLLQQVQSRVLEQEKQDTDPINLALLQAIRNDQEQLKRAQMRDQIILNNVERSLSTIQQQLLHFSDLPPSLAASKNSDDKKHILPHLSKIISIERVDPTTQQQMLTRSLLCKQASFSVGLARAALNEQDNLKINEYLNNALQLIKPLTDANMTTLYQQLLKIQSQQLPKAIQLSSLALLTGQKSVGS